MKRVLLFIHQLPQNLLGLLVILITGAELKNEYYVTYNFGGFGVSLGRYIILGGDPIKKTIQHEKGHQKQSLFLGWLYLLIIGLPSFCGNIWDLLFHRKWYFQKRLEWYYSQPWEHWADKLGGVERWHYL